MAEGRQVQVEDLAAQVDELSSMLNQIESGISDIHRAWEGVSRSAGRFAPSRPERQGTYRSRGPAEASTTQNTAPQSQPQENEGLQAGNGPDAGTGQKSQTDILGNLGSMFGKSPTEMIELVGKAQQILGGMNQMNAGGSNPANAQGEQRQEPPQRPVESQRQEQPGTSAQGVSASSVQKVGSGLPVKFQSVISSLNDAANQDPFVRTAVELDSRLRDLSDSMESIIGVLLLVRDLSLKRR